jgi:DnaJ homolog subfamily C member 28
VSPRERFGGTLAKWESPIEKQIREAIEEGVFDRLPGKGKPLDLSADPFEDPLMPTVRRILRDHGVTHPLIEARKAFEAEIEEQRAKLRCAWRTRSDGRASEARWAKAAAAFRERIHAINREIKLNNLKAPLPNFCIRTVDADDEIRTVQQQGA